MGPESSEIGKNDMYSTSRPLAPSGSKDVRDGGINPRMLSSGTSIRPSKGSRDAGNVVGGVVVGGGAAAGVGVFVGCRRSFSRRLGAAANLTTSPCSVG